MLNVARTKKDTRSFARQLARASETNPAAGGGDNCNSIFQSKVHLLRSSSQPRLFFLKRGNARFDQALGIAFMENFCLSRLLKRGHDSLDFIGGAATALQTADHFAFI